MKKTLFLVFFNVLNIVIFCQTQPFKKIDKKSLIDDIDSLVATVKNTHQNPYTYCSELDFEIAITDAKEQIKDSLNIYEFSKITAHLLTTLHDSHTYLNYGALRKMYQKEDGKHLGIDVLTIKNNYVIVKDKNNLIPIGSTLDSINGIPADYLRKEISKYSIFEGNSFNANSQISDVLFSSILGYVVPLQDTNTVSFTNGFHIEKIHIPLKNVSDSKQQKKKHSPAYTLEIDSILTDQLATIKIHSFSAKGNKRFDRFLKKSFKTIEKKKITNIAIDLRNNLGGQIIRTDILMGYLKENSVYIPSNIIAKQSKLSKKMYRKKINGVLFFFLKLYPFKNESLKNFIKQIKMKEGDVDTLYYTNPNPFYSKKHHFNGKTFLLINGMSGSASVLFASAYRNEIDDGIIIGEPCLGPRTGTWGNPANYVLPNSGLQVFISTIRTNIDNSFEIDPTEFKPDFYIPRTIWSVKNKTDQYLNFIRESICNQGTQ